jgi:hypothetical protein
MDNLTPKQRDVRAMIRGFLIGATPEEMQQELEIARKRGDKFRMRVIAEVIEQNLAGNW